MPLLHPSFATTFTTTALAALIWASGSAAHFAPEAETPKTEAAETAAPSAEGLEAEAEAAAPAPAEPAAKVESAPAAKPADAEANAVEAVEPAAAVQAPKAEPIKISRPGAAKPADLMIVGAQTVTMDEDKRVLENGTVVVKGDEIIAVGGPDLAESYAADRTIYADGDILMPGMINLHNHIPMVAFRGLGEYSVDNRLFEVFFPLEKELLNRNLIRVASRHAAIEMALAGVTLFVDMYYHEDEVARGVKDVGLRAVLGQTVIGFPVVDAPEPFGGLDYAEEFIKAYKDDPLIIPAVAPHAPYTVTSEVLLASKALSEKYNVPLVMHLAEFAHEKELAAERHPNLKEDETIIAYLDRIGFLGENILGAHVIYADANDRKILKARGVGVSHNPKANSRGGSGMAPGWEMYQEGVDVGLGTDGPMSSNQMDVLNVMAYAASIARLRQKSEAPFTPFELVDMITISAARAIDMEDTFGSLEVGKQADMVLLDTGTPNMQPNYDVYATIALSAYPSNVRTTIVDGVVLVDDGALQSVDLAAHAEEWDAVTGRVAEFAKTLEKR
ncbi:MAG: amidohydrolase [Pseudomonadota bacterium]